MSDNEKRKHKVFLKKNNEKSVDRKDDFYEYDKLKSTSNTLNEEFFENIESVDYNKKNNENNEKLKENEKEDIKENKSFNEDVNKIYEREEAEKLKETKSQKLEDEKLINEENDDDFGTIDDFKDDQKETLKEDSIFEKFDFSQNEDSKNINSYNSLFEDENTLKADYFENIDLTNKLNKESFDDDDDDFGSLDDFTQDNEDYEIKRKSFVNVDQKSNYYKEDDVAKQKRKKKKKKSKLKSFFKFLILVLFALVAMATYFGLTHDLFKIDYINIKGNIINEKEIILAKSGVSIGDNIFLTRKSKIKKNLKQISTIESVDVRKNYPNIIEIDIKENYVSAYINTSNGITTVDNFGKVKNTSAGNDEISGVQLKGLKETNFKVSDPFSKDDKKVKLILSLLNKSYYNNVSAIDFSDEEKIIFELKNSIKVSFGSLDNSEKKLKILSVLLKKIQTDGIKATEIILNVGKNPIIVKKS